MATGYFLCTDESEVFHTVFLQGGVLTTGQPVTNSYPTEEQMAVAIGTYTGNPNYYYENLVIPPFLGPFPLSLGEQPATTLTTVNLSYGPAYLQAFTVTGEDVDYLRGKEIEIQQGPFIITGIVSILESYAYNNTETYFNLVSTNSFQPYRDYGMNGISGVITQIAESASPYEFFSGITTNIPSSPSTQGYEMYGDLSSLEGARVYFSKDQSAQGEAILGVHSVSGETTLCYLLSGGSEIPYAASNNTISFIITNDAALDLPPTVQRIEGNGRTAYFELGGTGGQYQYFDLFENITLFGITPITIVKDGEEILGDTTLEIFYWGEDAIPCSRIRITVGGLNLPFTDQGTPITWYHQP